MIVTSSHPSDVIRVMSWVRVGLGSCGGLATFSSGGLRVTMPHQKDCIMPGSVSKVTQNGSMCSPSAPGTRKTTCRDKTGQDGVRIDIWQGQGGGGGGGW